MARFETLDGAIGVADNNAKIFIDNVLNPRPDHIIQTIDFA